MIKAAVLTTSLRRGQPLEIIIECEVPPGMSQVQVIICTAGTENPTMVISSGSQIEHTETGAVISRLQTDNLQPGVYEIERLGFSTDNLNNSGGPQQISYRKNVDFDRVFIEVSEADPPARRQEELVAKVGAIEATLKEHFYSGLAVGTGRVLQSYTALCFISGVLITRRFVFDRWEVSPYHGSDRVDYQELVNDFLREKSRLGIQFTSITSDRERLRSERPVCVAHFPKVMAASEMDVVRFCHQRAVVLTEVLSYYRGGMGNAFAIAVWNHLTGKANLVLHERPYGGNRLGGGVAGEEPEDIIGLASALESDAQLRYYVAMYKDACGEQDPDYQYVRYWQLLEMIAESRNYSPHDNLCELSGVPILDSVGNPRKLSRAMNTVYKLLLVPGVSFVPVYQQGHPGNQFTLMDYVEGCYAMRNATGHYGGFRPEDHVQKQHFRGYAQCERINKAQREANQMFALDWLKSTCKGVIAMEIRARREKT